MKTAKKEKGREKRILLALPVIANEVTGDYFPPPILNLIPAEKFSRYAG